MTAAPSRRGRFAPRPARPARRPLHGLAALVVLSLGIGTAAAAERRVVVGQDGRHPLPAAARHAHGATGRIECGGVRGVGQLTGRGDTVTSAAHVFFDAAGRSRADGGRCIFVLSDGAKEQVFALHPDPRACGSTTPYGTAGRHDWAVAELDRPVGGVRPYAVGTMPRVGDRVAVVAPEGGRLTVETCRVRDVPTGDDGVHEIRTDCTGYDGLSGAAYLTPGPNPRVVGLHVGFRSRHPDVPGPYAADHHTFGVALDGAFARTLRAARR